MELRGKFPKPHSQVASRIVDGEALIVLAQQAEVVVLNSVGSRVWELADGTRTIREIVETIVAEYNTTHEQADEDVRSFVKQLVESEMLVIAEASTAGL